MVSTLICTHMHVYLNTCKFLYMTMYTYIYTPHIQGEKKKRKKTDHDQHSVPPLTPGQRFRGTSAQSVLTTVPGVWWWPQVMFEVGYSRINWAITIHLARLTRELPNCKYFVFLFLGKMLSPRAFRPQPTFLLRFLSLFLVTRVLELNPAHYLNSPSFFPHGYQNPLFFFKHTKPVIPWIGVFKDVYFLCISLDVSCKSI